MYFIIYSLYFRVFITYIFILGTQQGATVANERQKKMLNQLQANALFFKRIRMVYNACNENCQLQGMEYTHIESLIPLKEEWDMKSEEKKTSEAYRHACEERNELIEVNNLLSLFLL